MRGCQGERLLVCARAARFSKSGGKTSHPKENKNLKKKLHGQIYTDNLNLQTLLYPREQ